MFFVCELCYEKQSSDGGQGPWPYTISKQSDQTNRVAAKLIPLAKGALLAGKAVNGIAGIGKLMVRCLPSASLRPLRSNTPYRYHHAAPPQTTPPHATLRHATPTHANPRQPT